MNPPKVREYDSINFLIAAQKAYSCTEAERVQPERRNAPAQDALTGDLDDWATNDLKLEELRRLQFRGTLWVAAGAIEEDHPRLKQGCGAERAQVRASRAQQNHIGLAIRAFLPLELHWFTTARSW